MEDFNFYEYGAEQKAEGKYLGLKIFLLCFYFIYVGAFFFAIVYTRIFPLGALIPVTLWILVYLTWGYVKPDYRYFIEAANFTFFVYYGKKTKIKKTSFKMSSAVAIAPADTLKDEIKAFAPKKIFSALPSVNANDKYAALYTDESGAKCVIYFVATAQALKLLHLHNSRTVVTKTVA